MGDFVDMSDVDYISGMGIIGEMVDMGFIGDIGEKGLMSDMGEKGDISDMGIQGGDEELACRIMKMSRSGSFNVDGICHGHGIP